MREVRRKERERDARFALDLVRDCEYAVLATVNADGSPYCIAISPVLDGDTIYFHCALEGQKIENILREPRVCLTCIGKTRLAAEKLTTEYESAVVYGTARMLENDADKIAALRLFSQKYMLDCLEVAERGIEQLLHKTGICKIEIAHSTGKERVLI